MSAKARIRRRSWVPAVVVTAVGVLAAVVPYAWSISRAAVAEPAFPSTMASYSWWTTPLAGSDMDAAVVVYQNGIGVEFMDAPQALVVGTDGSTYRRLGVAEDLAVPADQGDPAESVLSPDGTFAVVGSAGEEGGVVVVSLADTGRRSLTIGGDRAAVPVGIAADGESVLLLASDGEMSPYDDTYFQLHGALVLLDLESGAVEEYPGLPDVGSAALSPDGSTIAAGTPGGIVLMDAADGGSGVGIRPVDLPTTRAPTLDGDAWSPDGRRFAVVGEGGLFVVDATGDEPTHRLVALEGVVSGAAIGWRDDETVLVHSFRDFDDNRSFFSWVDVTTGEMTEFSSYTPNFTGASLASADVARDLIPVMRAVDRPSDRGLLPVGVNVGLALALGLVVWALPPRGRAPVRAEQP
jgi:hypothetical protein